MGGFTELNGAKTTPRLRSILIVGGGAPGWLAAATLARLLKPSFCSLRVIDSAPHVEPPFSAVALPSFHRLNALLGINEQDLMQRTRATFRLGTRFSDWGRLGDAYFHTTGAIGAKLDAVPFHQHWLRLRNSGLGGIFEDYSVATLAAKRGRFAVPATDRGSVLSLYSYGYHFDAALLADYLRQYACAHGVVRVAQPLVDVELRAEDGFIESVRLDDGSTVSADLYIDCRGGASLLSRSGAARGQEDWSRWLPCDRAVSVLCEHSGETLPHADVRALDTGWEWRVPLRQRVDSGHAYSSDFVSDEAAMTGLMAALPGKPLTEPRRWRLSAGRPARFWDKNCLQLAPAGVDSLEGTSLHLVQTGVARLVTLFPVTRFSPDDLEEFNRQTILEYDRIRDFLILHYRATSRDDAPFWTHSRHRDIPDTLRAKIELFQRCGRVSLLDDEHFGADSWLAVLLGQGIYPNTYDPLADAVELGRARDALVHLRSLIDAGVATLPTSSQYLDEYCPTVPPRRA